MKHLRILAFAATAMLATATGASAQEAYTTGDVNMRAGPGSRFPVVTTIPEDREVYIHGCLSDWDWCDVSWRRNRGWVFSDYLEALYRNRRLAFDEYRSFVNIPFVSFGFGYWDRYYRDRPWFDEWDHWGRRGEWRDRDHHDEGTRTRRLDYDQSGTSDGDDDNDRVTRRNRKIQEDQGQPEQLPGNRCGTAGYDDEDCPEASSHSRNRRMMDSGDFNENDNSGRNPR